MFIGREGEIDALERIHSLDGLKGVAVYGRRRIGKTTLLGRFCHGKPAVFFTASEASEEVNLRKFGDALATIVPSAANVSFPNFDSALSFTAEALRNRKAVIVIDELPYLCQAVPYFPSALQRHMDHGFAGMDLTVIVCGSSIGMMDDIVNGRKKPLYGRFNRQIKVKPLDYLTSSEFFPRLDNKGCAEMYGIAGGTPMYLAFMSNGEVPDAVRANFAELGGPLRDEPEILLREEFGQPSKPISIVAAMASGKCRVSEISDASGVERSQCSRYLSSLEMLGIVRRVAPVSNSKKGPLFELSEGLFKFKYSVVDRVDPLIRMGYAEKATGEILGMMPEFMGKRFEEICKEYVKANTPYWNVGKWWGPDPASKGDVEIDIVATDGLDATASALFCSCKYRSKPMGVPDLERLMESSSLVKGYTKRAYALFSSSGFSESLRKVAAEAGMGLYTLDDLFAGRRRGNGGR